MTDGRFSRRDWLRTVPVATLGVAGGVGSGNEIKSGRQPESIAQDTSGRYEQEQKRIADDSQPREGVTNGAIDIR
jgi:hypothetical protein